MSEPAFPIQKQQYTSQGFIEPAQFFPGMTMRDYFAGQALMGICSFTGGVFKNGKSFPTNVSRECYWISDAMLKERIKEPANG